MKYSAEDYKKAAHALQSSTVEQAPASDLMEIPAENKAALDCWDKFTQSYLVQKVAVTNGGLADLIKHDTTIRRALKSTSDQLQEANRVASHMYNEFNRVSLMLLASTEKLVQLETALNMARAFIKFNTDSNNCVSIDDQIYSGEMIYKIILKALSQQPGATND